MEYNYPVGARLVVELVSNQIFEGDCQKCAKDRIDMVNVCEYPSGKKLTQNWSVSYYRLEILSVRVLKQQTPPENIINYETRVSLGQNVIYIPKDEYDRLLTMVQNYTYMATTDYRYTKAVNHLSNCENISVVGIGSEAGRAQRINLLVLSSWDKIYIFDLVSYRRDNIESELKEILESGSITKVVHDHLALTDCLWHSHHVKLTNVFDTCIADLVLEKKLTGCIPLKKRNIAQCLAKHLNFPLSLLDNAMAVSSDEWEKRPLLESLKLKAAQLGAFLITLKNFQKQMLLKEFYDAVHTYGQLLENVDQYTGRVVLNDAEGVPKEIQSLL